MEATREIAELRLENETLRSRLGEAEDLIKAIRSGSIDAIIVSVPEGEKIYTLTGAEYPYRVMVESMGEGAVTLSSTGTIIYCNNSFSRTVQSPMQKIIGSMFSEYLDPETKVRFENLLRRKKRKSKLEVSLLINDSRIPVYLSISPVKDSGSDMLSVIITDLTHQKNEELMKRHAESLQAEIAERKRAENDLIRSEGRFRTIYENSMMGIVIGSPQGEIVSCNPAFSSIIGYSQEEIIGKSFEEISVGNLDEELKKVRDVINGNIDSYVIEKQYRRKDGEVITVLLSGSILRGEEPLAFAVIEDITKRKQAEVALRESENQLRSMAENVPCVLMRFDRQLRVVYLSKQSDRYNPNPVGRMIGRTNREMGLPEHLCDLWDSAMERVFSTGNHEEMEFDLAGPSGIRTFALKLAPEFGPDNEVQFVLGVSTDITERKQAEEALIASRNELQSIIDGTTSIVYAFDLESKFLLANKAVTELLKTTPEEMIGKRRYEFMDKETAQRHEANDRKVIEAGHLMEFEENGPVRKDGSLMTWLTTKFPLRNRQGEIYALAGISSDISDRKNAENILNKAKDELEDKVRERTSDLEKLSLYARSLIEASIDPLITVSADGKITDVNKASEKITGLDREELIGRVFSDFFTEPEKARAGYEEVFKKGYVRDYPLDLRSITGRITPVLYNASLYKDESGNVMGAFAAARNITKSRRMERKMIAAHKKLRALTSEMVLTEERSRQYFATELHDTVVQTMGAAKLRSQLIQNQIPSEAKMIFNEMQDLISQSIAEARTIMKEMSPPVLYELGFAPALEWICEQVQSQHNISIHFKAGTIPLLNYEMQILLFQSTRELLMNIIKHSKAKNAIVTAHANHRIFMIEIKDDGIGFEIKKKYNSDISAGGFGLFSIRERLGHFGGNLKIQSAPGQGTRVSMSIPRFSKK